MKVGPSMESKQKAACKCFMNGVVDFVDVSVGKVWSQSKAVHRRRSLRRRAYRNRVDIVNSTNETLWFNVLKVPDMDANVRHIHTLQSLTPIRSNERKSFHRSVPNIILVIYRTQALSSRLTYRTIASGATWEIFQETLDDYNSGLHPFQYRAYQLYNTHI